MKQTVEPGDTWKCECGEEYSLGAYEAAHWDFELIHTCEACGRRHSILAGVIDEYEKVSGDDEDSG